MSLYISSLNSGSNGNCYYVGNNEEAVLIDAGISCRETERRMKRSGLSMQKVKAIFISHEHGDHIRGVKTLANRYQLPVYITAPTLHHSRLRISSSLVRDFKAHEAVNIGGLSVTAFSKAHDAADPFSFTISCSGITVGVFTDIGVACGHLTNSFKQCHAAFLEANYDEAMLEQGSYPIHLKNRIRGGKGHLSNRQALEVFTQHRPSFMSHLFLAHLSKNNNDPELVAELFSGFTKDLNIVIASRYEETAVYEIHGNKTARSARRNEPVTQATLF